MNQTDSHTTPATFELAVAPHRPHVVFMGVWAVWYSVVIWAFTIVVDFPWVSLAILAAFVVYEALAIAVGWQNTLSVVVTWILWRLSKHHKPLRGWNWLAVIIAAPPSLLLWVTCWVLAPGFVGLLLGAVLALPMFGLLHDHWLRPDLHG